MERQQKCPLPEPCAVGLVHRRRRITQTQTRGLGGEPHTHAIPGEKWNKLWLMANRLWLTFKSTVCILGWLFVVFWLTVNFHFSFQSSVKDVLAIPETRSNRGCFLIMSQSKLPCPRQLALIGALQFGLHYIESNLFIFISTNSTQRPWTTRQKCTWPMAIYLMAS